MAERQKINIPEKLIKLYGDENGRIKHIWSYSKVSGIRQCVYEYYLSRIKKVEQSDNIYSLLGSSAHDILQDLYEGKIEYKDMANRFESEFLAVDIGGYKFVSDENQNSGMATKYKEDMIHFFKTHKMITQKVECEKEIWVDVNGHVFLGYIDENHDEGYYTIVTDYKTSTMYKGSDIYEHQKQLLLYAYGLHQLTGKPLDKFKIRWNFLKYVNINCKTMINITYEHKGEIKTSTPRRDEWVKKLKTVIRAYIKEYDSEIKMKDLKTLADKCEEENSLDSLPNGMREYVEGKFIFEDVIKSARRNNWVAETTFQTQLKKDLKANGIDDITIDMLLFDVVNTNSLEPLKNILDLSMYELEDCYVYGEVSQENIDILIKELCEDIELILSKGEDEGNFNRENIQDTESYYCNNLCGVKSHCPYYKKYIEEYNLYNSKPIVNEATEKFEEQNNKTKAVEQTVDIQMELDELLGILEM